MRMASRSLVLALTIAASVLRAQDITGVWQGTLDGSRIRMDVSREGDGRLTVARYNLDHGGWESPSVSYTASFERGVLDASFNRGDFTGRLAAKGSIITGTWIARGASSATPQPLEFARPSAATAWLTACENMTGLIMLLLQ